MIHILVCAIIINPLHPISGTLHGLKPYLNDKKSKTIWKRSSKAPSSQAC